MKKLTFKPSDIIIDTNENPFKVFNLFLLELVKLAQKLIVKKN